MSLLVSVEGRGISTYLLHVGCIGSPRFQEPPVLLAFEGCGRWRALRISSLCHASFSSFVCLCQISLKEWSLAGNQSH